MSDIKLKEIEPGMTIHCSTEGEAEDLLKHLDGLGYKWVNGNLLVEDTTYDRYGENTCYFIEKDHEVTYSDVDYFKNEGFKIVEFSDMIEPELTAEEVLNILGKICNEESSICRDCLLDSRNNLNADLCKAKNFLGNERKIIEICRQWKADHEKKEPEVELQEAARPLVEYLRKNYHPHATAIVSLDYAEILEGKESAKYGEEM